MNSRGRCNMKYLKDKKIILYHTEHSNDSEGFSIIKYIPFTGQIWAYVRQLSASEFYASRAVHQTEEMLFVVNWRPDVDANCFIAYRGVFYNITRVDTFEGYKQDLRLYAKLANSQPEPGDILEPSS